MDRNLIRYRTKCLVSVLLWPAMGLESLLLPCFMFIGLGEVAYWARASSKWVGSFINQWTRCLISVMPSPAMAIQSLLLPQIVHVELGGAAMSTSTGHDRASSKLNVR